MHILLLFATFLVSALLTYRLAQPGSLGFALAQPNARSLHTRPTPVSGGVAILTAFLGSAALLCWLYAPTPPLLGWLAVASLLLGVVAYIDDRREVSPLYRLLAQSLAAYLVLVPGGLWSHQLSLPGWDWVWPAPLGLGLSFLLVLWMTNLYNFMDGMDGFAGGMALFGFGSYALLGWLGGQHLYALLSLALCFASAGFLLFNFPPASIFMGDVGSSVLGLLAAAFALWGEQLGLFPLWVALLLFSPFVVDATLTLLRRLWQREKIWQAHRSHAYQRLVRLGWGHKKTVLWEYALMLGCSLSALLAAHSGPGLQMALLLGWAGVYLALLVWLRYYEKRQNQAVQA